MPLEVWHLTLAIAAAMLVLEIFSGTLVFLGFAISLIMLTVVHYFTRDFVISRDLAIFSIFSLVSIVLLRRAFRNKSDVRTSDEDVNDY